MTAGTSTVTGETTRHQDQSAPRPSARAMVERLMSAGYRQIEASNLAGLAVGLGPVASGWSVLEIERLRFVQHLDASGELPA
ncbi:MAG TPA: hypothetical protein VFW02_11050 [Candidatus Limnocylindrales bacterium]|nr:hypothetical protein [Candidatus Limnocylindrales bacterium]